MKLQKTDLRARIEETAGWIRERITAPPRVGLILGTGLGNLAGRAADPVAIPYSEIPNFAVSTVQSHAGNLLFGSLKGKNLVVMEGRFHYYEGYSLEEITFPVRVMKALGVEVLVISNAAGGMNPEFKKGDLVALTDHINLMGVNPLIGPNDAKLGIRFPDMIEPYSKRLVELAARVAKDKGLSLKQGVYGGVTGPNLETRAEYRFMRLIGCDLVGMSTVPEVIVGVHAGLEILAVSIVTDSCLPDSLEPVNIEEVIRAAQEASPKLDALVEGFVEAL
ncbi:MAG: purine-nucleoside phosphorylase [Candidatus Omnitrophica bacterium]|nr:purine-nucleoside phosphorylase [Candidatus Omnitrophota bacterium]